MKDGLMKAIWRGQVIAESGGALEVGGYRYFPRETVRMDLLLAAPKTQSDLVCPNGVQFYDVTDGAAQSRRAAWSHESAVTGGAQSPAPRLDPSPKMAHPSSRPGAGKLKVRHWKPSSATSAPMPSSFVP